VGIPVGDEKTPDLIRSGLLQHLQKLTTKDTKDTKVKPVLFFVSLVSVALRLSIVVQAERLQSTTPEAGDLYVVTVEAL
jgi:hypothetical protein